MISKGDYILFFLFLSLLIISINFIYAYASSVSTLKFYLRSGRKCHIWIGTNSGKCKCVIKKGRKIVNKETVKLDTDELSNVKKMINQNMSKHIIAEYILDMKLE